MSVQGRYQLRVAGNGPAAMVFIHGLGGDQGMWRLLAPAFQDRFRIVSYDLSGCGQSEPAAYDTARHASLHGHAADLLDILDAIAAGPVVTVGHSSGAIIGMLAAATAPQRFKAQVMIAPSPCYLNDGDYVGGFERTDVDALLDSMDADYQGWSRSLAPMIMGAPNQPLLREELTARFCNNDPAIARHFIRVSFLSDHRAEAARSTVPALILQCSDDLLAPREVGDWLHRTLPVSKLQSIQNVGHCPHMSAPDACALAMEAFLAEALE